MVNVRMGLKSGKSFTRGAVSLGGGNVRFAALGTFALVGIITTLNVASAKVSGPLPFSSKLFYAGAKIVGGSTLNTVLGAGQTGGIANTIQYAGPGGAFSSIQPGINPFGWANMTTLGGAVTLIVNGAIHAVNLPIYNQWVGPFIAALGLGLLIGGVVGGILDDPPNAAGIGAYSPPALANAPSVGIQGGLAF